MNASGETRKGSISAPSAAASRRLRSETHPAGRSPHTPPSLRWRECRQQNLWTITEKKETPSVRMVFSFWNVAGRLEHAASTGAKRVESRGPAGLLRMALPFVGCRQRVAPRDEDIAARTLEYMTAMETAPQPEASGLEGDYRILADFNGTILAGTHSKHGIQFVTWDRDYDRTDVALRWRNTGAAEKWDRKSRVFAEILFWLHLITLFFGSGVLYSKDNNS